MVSFLSVVARTSAYLHTSTVSLYLEVAVVIHYLSAIANRSYHYEDSNNSGRSSPNSRRPVPDIYRSAERQPLTPRGRPLCDCLCGRSWNRHRGPYRCPTVSELWAVGRASRPNTVVLALEYKTHQYDIIHNNCRTNFWAKYLSTGCPLSSLCGNACDEDTDNGLNDDNADSSDVCAGVV